MVRWWAVRFIRCGRIKRTSVLRPRTPFRPRHQSFGPHLQVDTGPEPPDWCRSTLRGWEPSLSANRQRIVSFRATAHRFVFGVSGRQRIAAFCVGPTRAEDFGLGAHVEKTEARNGQFARPVRLAVTEVIAIRLASMPLYQVELLSAGDLL